MFECFADLVPYREGTKGGKGPVWALCQPPPSPWGGGWWGVGGGWGGGVTVLVGMFIAEFKNVVFLQ